jgi:phosphatidylethanolamine-binding protein (PEBP) family uncharacterized protein
MNQTFIGLLLLTIFILANCSDRRPDAVELTVDFNWEGYKHCGMGLPEMHIGAIPENTKYLKISMYDHEHGFDHGEVKTIYDGSNKITRGSFIEITGPCPPPNNPGRYRITVKALDQSDVVIGVGKKERYFPEEK